MPTKKKVKAEPPVESILNKTTGIDEQLNISEFIASLIKINCSKNVLEIGVSSGITTYEILKVIKDTKKDTKYIGIDSADLRSEQLKEIMLNDQFQIADSISFLKSQAKETFDFVFVNGETNWAYMFQEFKHIENVLTPNAIIIYYNTKHLEGPRKLVQYASHYKYKSITLNTLENKGLSILHK